MPEVVNDPDLGPVTDGCDTCADLRSRLHYSKDGEVHPFTVVEIFSEKLKHEADTGHTTFGWRFTLQVRKLVDEFVELNNEQSPFWKEFKAKFLGLVSSESDSGM